MWSTNSSGTKEEKLDDKDIFSADRAKEMVLETKEKLKKRNRSEVFKQIKAQISHGYNKWDYAYPALFKDGNDIFFEGLGYSLTAIYRNSHTGAIVTNSGDDVIEAHAYMTHVEPGICKYISISWEG